MKTENNKFGILPYILLVFLLIASAIFLKLIYNNYLFESSKHIMSSGFEKRTLIIDAGHGGKDGGAVSVTGSLEKDLTLDMSLNMKEIFNLLGYDIIMTRETDIELTSDKGSSRKSKDLYGRLDISEKNPDVLFVSVHMNKFSQSKYSGLQVYYSPNNTLSKKIADTVQENIKNILQTDNNRLAKPATRSIFLLYKIKAPAILIECGFISNPNEAELLETKEYRQDLSLALVSSLTEFFVNS